MTPTPCSHPGRVTLLLALAVFLGGPLRAADPKPPGTLDGRAFVRPELTISTSHVPLEKVMSALPNRAAWEELLGGAGAARGLQGEPRPAVHIDPRSGAATNIVGAFPLVPGRGVGNRLTLETLGASLGRAVDRVDSRTVAEAFRLFALRHRAVLNIDVQQLGEVRATQVSPDLWQIHAPQEHRGVRVRDARLAGSVNNGNLVVVGTEVWGDVRDLDVTPGISEEQALQAGFAYIDSRSGRDAIEREPTLEIVPVAPPEQQSGEAFVGRVGSGYGHRLVWTFVFRRPPDQARWEVMVDAHSGEVIALEDINEYGEVKGGVYPLTNTEVCPDPERCGTMQSNCPMPFANTGLAAPNNFTDGAGSYDSAAGNATTTLSGRYVRVVDTCGAISVGSGSPTVDLGGTNGQHDCTSAGASPGNTSSSRSSFYELNRIAEVARGWLPSNPWLQSPLTANVNIVDVCNAFYSPSAGTVNFYRSGGGCRNTGEIAAIFDHEWGHALDDNDAAGVLSNSSEAYADIAAIYRLNASCVGYGFFWTSNKGCGQTADGTGFNQNENQVGGSHCNLDCSGVRDADWDKHADHQPDTALGFVCGQCTSGTGPCGRQVHCAAAPARQAAWDLVARDLQAAPFGLDAQTALIIGNRLFYQGSGNIGLWHACTCGASSSGCGATNGYMQWLSADDDNGNLADGTPHMTAIYNAFNRHGIACSTPAPQNGGCAGGPTEAPALAVTAGIGENQLSWTTVAGATTYRVFRSEGHAGCDMGKTLVAEVTGAEYTDSEVATGREYSYNVLAVGSSAACFSPASLCVSATPTTGPDFAIACSPSSLAFPYGGGERTSTCTVSSLGGFAGEVLLDCTDLPVGGACSHDPASVTLSANGSATTTLTLWTTTTTPPGTHVVKARGVSGSTIRTFGLTLTVPVPGFTFACSPSSLTVPLGGTGSGTCTVSSVNGFADPVSLSCSSLPAGVTCGYSPNPATPPADGTVASALAVGVAPATAPGTYTLQARAVAGALTRTFNITLRIPDFSLTCSPSSLSIPVGGGSRTSTCTITSLLGFAGEVALDCANLPSGASCSYAPASVTPPVGGIASSTLTFTTSATTPTGTYTFQARGVSGPRSRTVNMTLTVAAPDFFLSCPSSLTINQGSTNVVACTVTATNGFVTPTTLGCSNLPAGVTCAFSPNPVIPPGVGSVGSALTLAVSPTTLPGSYAIQATASAGAVTKTFAITLRVADFTLACNPGSVLVPAGGTSTSTCTLGSAFGFASLVSLSCVDLPVGVTCSPSPSAVTPPAASTLTVAVAGSAPDGTYAFQVQGAGGGITRSFPITLQVRGVAAAYDPVLKAPRCGTVSSLCDSGVLLVGRDGKGPEPNQPNTIGGSCLDGTSGTFHSDESNDRVTLSTLDGGKFAAGKTVKIEARVWAWTASGADKLDLYYAATGASPTWTYLTSVTATTAGAQTLSANYTLPAGSLQAVRARFRYGGAAAPCLNPVGSFDDHDDLLFAVNRPPLAQAGGPYVGVRQQAIAFDGAASSDPDGDALTYSWDFGDGTTGTGPAPTHAYASVGEYTATLVVSDGTDSSAAAPTVVSIGNHPPVAQAGGPYGAVRNEAIAFDGTGSSDPDGDELTYAWDFGDGTTGTGPTPTHAYTSLGNHTVTLVVSDGADSSAPSTTSATAFNQAPVANAGPPQSSVRHRPIAFDGTGSSDPDGDALTYAWDFGDGATGTGPTPTHEYTVLGSHVVTLVVSDGTDSSSPSTTTITIANQAPVAQAGGPYTGVRNQPIEFDATGSGDADGDPLTFSWDFGDGTTGSGPVTHAYTSLGTFTATLVVSDGIDSATAPTTVTINNLAPVVDLASPGPGALFHAPADVLLGAMAADPDGSIARLEFFQGPIKIGEGEAPSYSFLWTGVSPGAYVLTARATDESGTSTTSAPVPILVNARPIVSLTAPASGSVYPAPASVTLTASAADPDGVVSQVEYFQGSTSLGVVSASPYALTWPNVPAGQYSLTARAIDDRGGVTVSAPVTITVEAHLPPTADAYVRDGSGNTNQNFGSAKSLIVKTGSSGVNRWTYLKFNTSALASAGRARLRLFGRLSATTSVTVVTSAFPSANTSWVESVITWNNRPAAATTALSSVTMVNTSTESRWYEWDVTAYLQQEKAAGRHIVTLVLKNAAPSSPYDTFMSKEATSSRPELVIVP